MRRVLFVTVALISLGFVAAAVVAGALSAPCPRAVGEPPIDLGVEVVSIVRNEQPPIAGWFIQGRRNMAGVLLLHSVRSDRRQMIGRAYFLRDAGYSLLLIDMQAHGETPGANITFGYIESRDVHDAVAYLRSRVPGRPVGLIGVSLGGAAALLGDGPISADAVVLEAVYSSIERAVENRLAIRFGSLGKYLAPLLISQIEPRLGFSTEMLSPLSAISQLKSPVLIIAGDADRHTLLSESRDLFMRASDPKSLWIVQGAEHENLHQFSKMEYEQRVLGFFHRYLD